MNRTPDSSHPIPDAPHRAPVIVGASRSVSTVWAVHWAAEAASLRGVPLLIVHAQEWPPGVSPSVVPGGAGHLWSSHFRAAGQSLVDTARSTALAEFPDLDVSVGLAEGKPHDTLLALAGDAHQIVVGSRLLTELESVFAGSAKGAGLLGRVPCPVVLVPPPEEPGAEDRGDVVVGVDGSAASEAAVAYAYEEAALSGSRLLALEVRRPHTAATRDFIEESRLDLAEALAGWRDKYPEVETERQVLTGYPPHLLAAVSRHARCLVVGTHGRSGWHERLLGSTSRALVHHTHCPLVVVPVAYPGDGTSA